MSTTAADIHTLTGTLTSEAETRALARALAPQLRPGDCIGLSGPVGAGKSVFAREVIQAAQAAGGVEVEDVPSPSYTLIQRYEAGARSFVHADLYRLGSSDEIPELGLDASLESAVCLIEWPERLDDWLPARRLMIMLSPDLAQDEQRGLSITATGSGWGGVMAAAEGGLA